MYYSYSHVQPEFTPLTIFRYTVVNTGRTCIFDNKIIADTVIDVCYCNSL